MFPAGARLLPHFWHSFGTHLQDHREQSRTGVRAGRRPWSDRQIIDRAAPDGTHVAVDELVTAVNRALTSCADDGICSMA